MNEQKQILNKLITEISGNQIFTIATKKFGEGLLVQELKDLEEELNVKIHDNIHNVYRQFNGFKFNWNAAEPSKIKGNIVLDGTINILKFYDMMIGYDGNHWLNELWFENMPTNKKALHQSLKIFDYYNTESIQCVCLQMSKQRELIPKLWLFSQGLPALELSITFSDYFNMIYKTKAIWGWQSFFVKQSLKGERYFSMRRNCELIIEGYVSYFDDNFEEELKNRYMELKK